MTQLQICRWMTEKLQPPDTRIDNVQCCKYKTRQHLTHSYSRPTGCKGLRRIHGNNSVRRILPVGVQSLGVSISYLYTCYHRIPHTFLFIVVEPFLRGGRTVSVKTRAVPKTTPSSREADRASVYDKVSDIAINPGFGGLSRRISVPTSTARSTVHDNTTRAPSQQGSSALQLGSPQRSFSALFTTLSAPDY